MIQLAYLIILHTTIIRLICILLISGLLIDSQEFDTENDSACNKRGTRVRLTKLLQENGQGRIYFTDLEQSYFAEEVQLLYWRLISSNKSYVTRYQWLKNFAFDAH